MESLFGYDEVGAAKRKPVPAAKGKPAPASSAAAGAWQRLMRQVIQRAKAGKVTAAAAVPGTGLPRVTAAAAKKYGFTPVEVAALNAAVGATTMTSAQEQAGATALSKAFKANGLAALALKPGEGYRAWEQRAQKAVASVGPIITEIYGLPSGTKIVAATKPSSSGGGGGLLIVVAGAALLLMGGKKKR